MRLKTTGSVGVNVSELIYRKNVLLPEEYNELRKNVGWGKMDHATVVRCLKNSLFGISVYHEEVIVGSGRVVGDDGLCFYIQDIMVRKGFQKKGIGTKIVELLFEYLAEKATYNSYIGVMSAKNMQPFYSRFGFFERPNEHFGPGMTQFWGRKGESTEC
jgi:GNAT superfamily N-acetyltransferase